MLWSWTWCLPMALPMLRAARAIVENCILTDLVWNESVQISEIVFEKSVGMYEVFKRLALIRQVPDRQ
jgi:hypothetical protein